MPLTPAEGRGRAAAADHGLRVTFPCGTVHWYPGGTAALAAALFERAVPPDLRAHPATKAEWGRRQRGAFVALEAIKEGRADAADARQ